MASKECFAMQFLVWDFRFSIGAMQLSSLAPPSLFLIVFSLSLFDSFVKPSLSIELIWTEWWGEIFLGVRKPRNGFLQSLSKCGRAQNVLVEFYQVWKCIKLFRAHQSWKSWIVLKPLCKVFLYWRHIFILPKQARKLQATLDGCNLKLWPTDRPTDGGEV